MSEKLLNAAIEAGLNYQYAMAVACGYMTLEEALGGMDMDDESLPFIVDAEPDVDDDLDLEDCIPW